MDIIFQQLNTMANLYVIKYINTGDKILDNAFVVIIGVVISYIIIYFTNRDILKFWYNRIVRKIRRQKDPFDFKTEWYFHDNYNIIKNTYKGIYTNTKIGDIIRKLIIKYPNKVRITNDEDEDDRCCNLNYEGTSLIPIKNVVPLFYNGIDIVYYENRDNIIFSKTLNSLQDFIGYINMMDNKSKEKEIDNNLKIYHYTPKEILLKGEISSNKTFDRLYYDQKNQVVDLVEKFSKGTMYPKSLCLDNKLGIILYGKTGGCSKTSTLLSIANYLKRDILVIDFTKVTKREDLDKALNIENMKKYIYVFDEFDCILDVLVSNNKENHNNEKDERDWSKILMVAEGEERKEILKMMKENMNKKNDDQIDLGYLLSKLDGLESSNGRIIIATTNNIEHINPLLLRPGRFDLKLELGKCSMQMYKEILNAYFGEIDETMISQIEPYRWSSVEVINFALKSKSFNECVETLSQN